MLNSITLYIFLSCVLQYDADPTDKWFKVCPDLSEAGEIVHILLEALPAEGMEANMLLRNVFLKAKSC